MTSKLFKIRVKKSFFDVNFFGSNLNQTPQIARLIPCPKKHGCLSTLLYTLYTALAWNFFYMGNRTKKWYFYDPTGWYLAYPRFISGCGVACCFYVPYPDEFREDFTPAMKYCPYYVAELQPGDVLLNTACWGHGVRNLSEKSVGIATCWSVDGIQGKNFMHVEENYDINRWASFNFFSGINSTHTCRCISCCTRPALSMMSTWQWGKWQFIVSPTIPSKSPPENTMMGARLFPFRDKKNTK